MPLCAVTITAVLPSGAVLASTPFTFETLARVMTGLDGLSVVPERIVATTNGSGVATVNLYPGSYLGIVSTSQGELRFPVRVPNAATAQLSLLINTPDGPYEIMLMTDYQTAFAEMSVVYNTETLGISATADGGLFFAIGGSGLNLFRRSGATAIPVYLET